MAGPLLISYSMTEEHDPLTERIIGCAIEVHRCLGAGLLERPYEVALCIELAHQGIRYDREKTIPLLHRGLKVGDFRPDLIVEDAVVVEVKSVLQFEPVFVAQMLTYLRLTGLKRGLILNFNRSVLKAGIKRVSL
jgi:GxxExxY protein